MKKLYVAHETRLQFHVPLDSQPPGKQLHFFSMTEPTLNLESLMRSAQAGNQQAYATVLHETARRLRPYLAKRLGSAGEAEDVLQEILISIHKARHTYDGQRPYKPWAYAIARFRLNDYLRSHYADQLRQAVDIDELENILHGDVTEPDIDYESIREAVGKLPEKQAAILQLMHEQGYTAKETATKLGMTESAVKVAAHRAYKVLREKLGR